MDFMKKKQMLATMVMLSLLQGSVYAAEYPSKHFEIHENVEWGDYALEVDGSRGVIPYGGDTVTIDDGVTLTMDFASGGSVSGSAGGLALSIDEMNGPFGDENKDLNMSGGRFIAIGEGQDESGIGGWITDTATGRIMINNTDIEFRDFTYGFAIKGSEAHVVNDSTYLENRYGVYAYNTGKFFGQSKDFSIVNGEVGLYSAGQGSISVNSDSTLFQNNTCAVTTTGEGKVDLIAKKLHMIDNNYGVSSNGDSVSINASEFLFGTSMAIDFPIIAVYGGANTNIDVTAGKAVLNGQILAEENASIKFLKDNNEENKQLIGVYSSFGDAVSAASDNGKANIDFEANTIINSQNDKVYHSDKQGIRTIAAIRANRNSEITLDNAAGVYGDIIAGRGNEVETAIGGKVSINSLEGAEFKGDVLAGNGGEINFTLNGASYEGRIDDYADATLKDLVFRPDEFDVDVTSGGTVNLTLNNNSTWTARGQNFVTELNFGEDGGVVDLSKEANNSVTIRNLKGDGTFNMLLNSENHALSDMLYIGKNEGNQTINIVGGITGGLENISKDNPLRFATVGIDTVSADPDVNNSGISAYTRDSGVFDLEYFVDKEAYNPEDINNELYNGYENGTDESGNDIDKPGNDFVEDALVANGTNAVNWIITGAKEVKQSDAGKTIINMSKVNYNNAIYMDRLNKRLGEARYINPEEEQGMWVRLRHDRIGKENAFRSQNTMYELGYDVKQDCDNGEHRTGFALDYMDGKAEYTGIAGDGDIKRYGLWLYDTWLGDKGHYTDFVAKWGHLENDFDIMAKSTGEKITGDYSNNVFSVSAEYGKKNDMGKGWYFEPQAQLQLARVTGADYVTSQGTKVSLDGINSLIGRAGFRLGRDLNESSTVYVKADFLHEFLGEQGISATDITGTLNETYENKGTWYDVGFGFATAMGKNSYAFMDFEKSFGNDNDETYQINAGVQWTF